MVDATVVGVVQAYLVALERSGLPVQCAVVFGSQVAGRVGHWSDIDVVIVSPVFDDPHVFPLVAQLWKVAARVDSRIEPIPCGVRQWREDDSSPIIEVARRHGERVELPRVA